MIPKTTLNWKHATSRPLHFGGAISAMYIGANTEDPPMANPPMKRKQISAHQFHASPHPTAEIR